MSTLGAILLFGLLMSLIALVGGVTLILREQLWKRLILPLIAFAAGSLIGGAFFHMIPSAVAKMGNVTPVYVWLTAGFILFYALEEFLHWHHSHTHSHNTSEQHDLQHPQQPASLCCGDCESTTKILASPSDGNIPDVENAVPTEDEGNNGAGINVQEDTQCLGWLILVADAVHNFLGGMFVGASFVDSTELGISAWLAAAAHEVPQELGDFAILVHGGWSKRNALLFNFISALTFPLGGLIAYAASKSIDVSFLIPFAAGNFLYIGASDLIPEIKHHYEVIHNLVHFASFLLGAGIMLGIRIAFVGW